MKKRAVPIENTSMIASREQRARRCEGYHMLLAPRVWWWPRPAFYALAVSAQSAEQCCAALLGEAVIAAPAKLVIGAVGKVDMAREKLSADDSIHLSDDRQAALVPTVGGAVR